MSQTGAGEKSSGAAVFAWSLYDFANTIFAVSILTVYFPLWISEISGAEGVIVNAATAFSALLVLISAPLFGTIADLRQRRVPYLITLTLLAVALTGLMGLVGLPGGSGTGTLVIGVALFIAADLAYQSALVFYNALLPGVALGRGTGRVSGYGTALGYVGSIVALVVLAVFVSRSEAVRSFLSGFLPFVSPGSSSSDAFVPTALLFLVFSLPAFFLVPDRVPGDRPQRAAVGSVSISGAYREILRTLRGIRAYGGMGTFLLATLLYTDAANTAVANVALYGRVVFGMDTQAVTALLLFSTVFAIVGSFVFGLLSDRIGPKRSLIAVIVLWMISIILVSLAPSVTYMYVAGPFVGVALGATWTVSRPMLIALSPPDKLGEFFGLFTFAGKVSAVAGPALTALLLFLLDDLGALAYRISIGSLAAIMVVALVLMVRVPDVRPDEEGAGAGKVTQTMGGERP